MQEAKLVLTNSYIINKTELLYGACNSSKKEQNLKKISYFLSEMTIHEFSHDASVIFAEQKVKLKKQGRILADMDLMIASITLANNAVLVTNNAKHFERIKPLQLDNWFKA